MVDPEKSREGKEIHMSRDGLNSSLWQEIDQGSNPLLAESNFSTADNAEHHSHFWDVVIVGAGITGLTTALTLQRAGKKCLILEAHSVGFGTTGGTTSHINTMLDTPYHMIEQDFGLDQAKLVAEATVIARETISNFAKTYEIDCDFEYKSGVLFAQNEQESEELDKIYKASLRAGVEVSPVDQIPVPLSFQKAIAYEKQAQIHPLKYLQGLEKAYLSEGGTLLTGIKVTGDSNAGEHQEVETTQGTFRAKHLIYATHIPPGVNILHFRCAPYRSYVLAARLDNNAYPIDLAYDMKEPYHYFRTHRIGEQEYLIVGGEDHKTGHGDPEASMRDLEVFARKHFAVEEFDYRWSAQFFESADGLPYIGVLPGSSGDCTYVATGFSGNGIVFGTFSGSLLSDLVLGRTNKFEKLFSPGRIKPIAAFKNIVKENADALYRFVADRLSVEKLKSMVDLVPGTGAVVKYEGENIALYKSADGHLNALSPTCTHAGCTVAWNNFEKSWDCPCHGGRYDIEGNVLTGPPRQNLRIIKLKTYNNDYGTEKQNPAR